VTVLYEGRQIYFGPVRHAKQYFIDMGYHCPERQTTADFLTSLTNPSERIAQPGAEDRVPKTPDEFANAWKESLARARLLRQIHEFAQKFPIDGDEEKKFMKARTASQAHWT
jgi:ABC-type multidrug transport system ATPase subunit